MRFCSVNLLCVCSSNNINGMFDKVQMQSASDAASSTVPVMFISFPTAKDPSREERFPGINLNASHVSL